MSIPRRRLIRRPASPATAIVESEHRLQQLRTRLAQERAALQRWPRRLKRAFPVVEKRQRAIGRLEREIAQPEERCHGERCHAASQR